MDVAYGMPSMAAAKKNTAISGTEFQVLTVAEFQQALEKFGFQLAPEDFG